MNHAKFSWYHAKAIIISGAGFYTDAYDLFIISLVTPMVGPRYPARYLIVLLPLSYSCAWLHPRL